MTNLEDAGDGSLRAQIAAANANADLSEVRFADGLGGTLALESTLLVTAPIEIRARERDGIVLDGGGEVRVLQLSGSSPNQPHVLEGLTLQNGSSTLGGANVRVFGSLQLLNCLVQGGRSVALNGNGNNPQNADGGGLFHSGGELLIADSSLLGNAAVGGFSQGGGFYTENGNARMVRSRVVANTTNGNVGEGGGIASRSIMVIEDCEISENETLGRSSGGGGIFTDTRITISQTTISRNVVGAAPGTGEAGYSVGGAFANVGSESATFLSCTITENFAPIGKGQGGGLSSLSLGVLSFQNCIVTGNQGGGDLDETPNRALTYRDDGANLFGVVTDTNLAQLANRNPTSRYEVGDPNLSDLDFFGGTTRVHLPLAGSPALDGGSALSEGLPLVDQRGGDFPRLVGERLDIGSVEQQQLIDENNNSLPDAVERIIAGFEESNGDFDGDGASDVLEYLFLGVAAISDAALSPSFEIQQLPDASTLQINFATSPNREYRLLAAPNLQDPLTPVVPAFERFLPTPGGRFSVTIDSPRAFYRVEARIPPAFQFP